MPAASSAPDPPTRPDLPTRPDPPTRPHPPSPPARPVRLVPVDRTHRAVLENLGQLYRHDLSGPYGHLPNADGMFNNRRLDLFLARPGPAGPGLAHHGGGRARRVRHDGAHENGTSIHDFFVVRALRRTGVGREVARQVIAMFPGRWSIAFQAYNPGVQRFWSQVATDAVGDRWRTYDGPSASNRPPDTWITFQT